MLLQIKLIIRQKGDFKGKTPFRKQTAFCGDAEVLFHRYKALR